MSAETPAVTVIVPTLGRPESLERAVRSVLAQTVRNGLELVVVDNDPARSAQTITEQLAEGAPFPVRYVSEPRPGVSNARNAGLLAASGELIAFLDDDESAPPDWLGHLLAAHKTFGADAVFGPVRAELPDHVRAHRGFLQRFFSREGPAQSGPSEQYHGCGNSLLRRAALPAAAPFSDRRNAYGGEDDLLFGGMKVAGARFAWCAEAWVWEHVPASRAALAYALKRGFAFGQGPSAAAAAAGPRRWPMVPVWMGIGLGQAAAFGALAVWRGARGQEIAPALDRAVQGLGKLVWFPPFKFRFYGPAAAAAVERSRTPSG